jgi:hypothetical protein
VIDQDTPLELLWEQLRQGELWQLIEAQLLDKRDRMVAQLVVEEDCKPKRANNGSSVAIAAEDPAMVLARIQRKIGYIEAINAIVAAPAKMASKVKQETT